MNLKEILSPYKGTLVTLAVKELMKLLVTRVSFFALGPVYWVTSQILSWVIQWGLNRGIQEAEITWSAHEKMELAEALSSLLLKYDKEPDPKIKEDIENEIIDNSRDLIKVMRPGSIDKRV